MLTLPATPSFALRLPKLFWFKVNRVLAWSLLISPLLQIALRMPAWTAFWIDLAILIAHGLVSLLLFGIPADQKGEFAFWMHVMGFRPRVMGARARFLFSGYRIAMLPAA